MWDKGEKLMYRDQNMKFGSVGSDIPFMPSTRFPPPNNSAEGHFFVEASRKRKSLDMDSVHGVVSAEFLGNGRGNMGHSLQREYAFQHNETLPPPIHSRVPLNHNAQSANPINAASQYGPYNMDNSLLTTETKDENAKIASFGSVRPFSRNEPSFPVQSLQDIPEHHDSKHLVCDIGNRYEPIKFPLHYRQHSGVMEISQPQPQPQAAFRLDDGKTLGLGYNSVPSDPYLYRCNLPSSNTSTLGSSNFMVFNESFHPDVGNFDQHFNRIGLVVEKERGQVTRLEGDGNISVVRTNSTQTPGFSVRREAYDFYQHCNNEMQSGSSIDNNNLGTQLHLREVSGPPTSRMQVQTECSLKEGCLDHISKGFETKLLERTEGSNPENTGHPLAEATPLMSGNSIANRPEEPENGQAINMEECNLLVAGKVSPLMAEKLWDGSLQLNTSITVSALAFFKSGEKASDMKWSEHIEIKGKVRLQAFEKFIQELPRSRNRTLMVISLCWKPGSSEAGLAGMKEVAKGYKETKRVGFAHISPGFDIYVCPRTEAIITILAKYGFFKGMAAVDGDRDSLIGCVIWRRGQNTLNPVPKISEKKKTSNSPDSSGHETNSPIMQVDQSESKQEKTPSPLVSKSFENEVIRVQPPAAQRPDATLLQESTERAEIPVTKVAESRQQTNTDVTDGSRNFANFNSCPPPGFTTSISLDSSFTGTQLPTSKSVDSSYRLNPMQSNSNPELARSVLSGPPPLPPDILHRITQFNRDAYEAPTEGIPKAGTSFMPSEEPKKCSMGSKADEDDDTDLPEFDFDSAYGVQDAPASRFPCSSHQTNVKPPFNRQVTSDGVKNENWPVPTSNVSGIPCRTSAYERSPQFEELNSKKPEKSALLSPSFPKKSRWDIDDDDMPEWCPPILEDENAPKSSIRAPMLENAKELPLTTLRPPPPQSQSFSHRYNNPGTVQNRPRFGYAPADFRPPQVPHPDNFARPPVTKFSTKAPNSDFDRQWKRQ